MPKREAETTKEYLKSSWTPLSDAGLNSQIFQERRQLFLSWFNKWTDRQRKHVLVDIISLCTTKQQEYAASILQDKVPKQRMDFTRILPRVLTFYIFSFLDPRSLCRCSQVSWYWKYLTEANELWVPKCIRRGWNIFGTKDSSQPGIWKNHYVEKMIQLRVSWPIKAAAMEIMEQLDKAEREAKEQLNSKRKREKDEILSKGSPTMTEINEASRQMNRKPVPWRGSDKHPKDTRRSNYFDNVDGSHVSTRKPSTPGRAKTPPSDQATSEASPERKVDEGIPVSSRSTTMPLSTLPINRMAYGPREPWRPNSKYPKRRTPTGKDEQKKKVGATRQSNPTDSKTVPTTPHEKENRRRRTGQKSLTAMTPVDLVAFDSTEEQNEDMPPPPGYSAFQQHDEDYMTQPIDAVTPFGPPVKRTSVSSIQISPIVQELAKPSAKQKTGGVRSPRPTGRL